MSPQPGQALYRLGHQSLDLRVDLDVAKVGAVGDAQAAQVQVFAQPRALPWRASQTVPRIGASHAVEHQHGVVHRAGHRPEV
ncbi:hypothetical protein D3C79_577210 [compost metagenome]